MIRDYVVNLSAGVEEPRGALGNLIHFRQCSDADAAVAVQAYTEQGELVVNVLLRQGQKIHVEKPFVEVRFLSATAINCNFVIGAGEYQDDRPNGTVSISGVVSVDPVADTTFPTYSRGTIVFPIATQYGTTVLRNPAGSGKTLYVKSVRCGAIDAGQYMFGLTGKITTATATDNGAKHDSASAASVGLMGTHVATSAWLTEQSITELPLGYGYQALGVERVFEYAKPVAVPAGNELYVAGYSVDSNFDVNIEWDER